MAVTDDMKAAINDAIKALYSADVSAIQNLSEIAKKLQEGGLTVVGDLKITSNLNVAGAITSSSTITATNLIVSGTNTCNMADIFSRLKTAEADIAALKQKSQFITSVASRDRPVIPNTIAPNVMTFNCQVIIDTPSAEIPNKRSSQGLIILNGNELEVNNINTGRMAHFSVNGGSTEAYKSQTAGWS